MAQAKLFHGVILLLSGLIGAGPVLAAEKPMLQAGAERSTPGEVRPSNALVRVVLGALDKDDVEGLRDCLADNGGRRGDYGSLLRAVRVNAGPGHDLWFVRAAQEPYCPALNGAHAFRYFWVEARRSGARPRYRVLFENNGDGFAVYRRKSHGLNDIEVTGCIASGCRIARMSFDGRHYRPIRCTVSVFKSGREVTRQRRCGSDDWSDGQASGFQADFH